MFVGSGGIAMLWADGVELLGIRSARFVTVLR